MPRYNYKCSSCGVEAIIFHLLNEKVELCTSCEESGTMIKQLTTPVLNLKKDNQINNSVGEITKDYIEKNRELLEHEKDKARKQTYEST
tara:strand:+ start:93 stop:359 length:267 start_codon:yes stop_codon:yes gene_type:complete